MVIISFKGNEIKAQCTSCKKYKTMSATNFCFDQLDALAELCPNCFGDVLISKIRQFQRNEGNPDCFAKSDQFCDQKQCRFRQQCLGMEKRG